jgi:hypothetical protein
MTLRTPISCPAQGVAAQYAEGVGRDGWETEAEQKSEAESCRNYNNKVILAHPDYRRV